MVTQSHVYIKHMYLFRSKMIFSTSFGIVVGLVLFVFFVTELPRKQPKTM